MRGADGRRRSTWVWVAGLAAVALVLSFLLFNSDLLEVGDQLASVLSCLIALATAAITLAARRGPPPDPEDRLADAKAGLARRINRQWTREADNRGLLHGEPLRVRWASTDRPVQPAASEVAGAGVTRLKLHGDVLGIAAKFRQLPHRKLVVIGAPGAGKSSLAVLLLAGLLEDPRADEPVPVLLDVAGWNPAEHLDVWLARQIAEQYPSVGRERSRELVERGQVMPILDGLDEIPASLQPAAVTALADAFGGRRPFVLTCRAIEYEQLMAATGVPLARAAVVEIEPVGPAEAAHFLPTGQINGAKRWAPVIAELTENPHGELARTLVTPLMVYLTRIVYATPRDDPAELLSFTSSAEVERHLFGEYLPAIYQRDGANYPADRARLWLAYLAGRDGDLAWWRLSGRFTVRPTRFRVDPLRALGGGICGGLIGWGVTSLLHIDARAALMVGGGAALVAMMSGRPGDLDLMTPHESLRRDRFCGLALLLSALLTGLVAAGPGNGAFRLPAVAAAVVVTVLVAPLLALLPMPGAAWVRFCVWRAWQAARHRLPLRLMTFLEDAHRRGVLRQVGPVYQFRHARLREHLAQE